MLSSLLGRLKKRKEFKAVAATKQKWVTSTVIVQICYRSRDTSDSRSYIRYGLTASRKVGKAVVRNRARRRLRHIAQALLTKPDLPPCDIVFIARARTVTSPFKNIVSDVTYALKRLGVSR